MRIDILTVFPEMVTAALDHSIIKRAMERGLVTIRAVNIRDFTEDRHHTTDDVPYGGGGGMVMKIEPIARALESLTGGARIHTETSADGGTLCETESASAAVEENKAEGRAESCEDTADSVPSDGPDAFNLSETPRRMNGPRVILTDPRGQKFTQELARKWAREEHIIVLCGHYEGVDERVRRYLVTDEVSIGDFILTGGELPALMIADALTRLQPGALGDEEAPDKDTFSDDLLEYPHYTRPREFRGWEAPDILLCGHHAQIQRWRRWHQLRATKERRPDLFARLHLSPQDEKLLNSEEPQAPPAKVRPARRETATPTTKQAAEDLEENHGTRTTDNSGD